MTVFFGTLWCSTKKIEAPDMFDWENGIALHAMQGNRASFPSKGDVSYDFSSCGRNLGYIREYSMFLPQLEKSHDTYNTPGDEACFPCIGCRAIQSSESDS